MALANQALTTLTTAKKVLGATGTNEDEAIERQILAVSDAFSQEAGGRQFQREAAIVERHKGFGLFRLIAKVAPIVTITAIASLNPDGTVAWTYDSTTYEFPTPSDGIIYGSQEFGWSARSGVGIASVPIPGTERPSIRLTYTAGWITPWQATSAGGSVGTRDLPYDIEQAVLESIQQSYKRQGRDADLASESYESTNKSWHPQQFDNRTSNSLISRRGVETARRYWRAG